MAKQPKKTPTKSNDPAARTKATLDSIYSKVKKPKDVVLKPKLLKTYVLKSETIKPSKPDTIVYQGKPYKSKKK